MAKASSATRRKPPSPVEEPAAEAGSGQDSLRIPASFENLIGYHLRIAQEASFHAFRQRVGNPDLKPGRYAILTVLDETPGLTPSELAQLCGRDKSTVTPAIKDLVARGLVRRQRSPGDQRSYRIRLTPTGKGLLEQLRVHANAHDEQLNRIVGEENVQPLIHMLRRIAQVLTEESLAENGPAT